MMIHPGYSGIHTACAQTQPRWTQGGALIHLRRTPDSTCMHLGCTLDTPRMHLEHTQMHEERCTRFKRKTYPQCTIPWLHAGCTQDVCRMHSVEALCKSQNATKCIKDTEKMQSNMQEGCGLCEGVIIKVNKVTNSSSRMGRRCKNHVFHRIRNVCLMHQGISTYNAGTEFGMHVQQVDITSSIIL